MPACHPRAPVARILMTRAPMSPSSMVQYGPDITRVKSMTVIPWSGGRDIRAERSAISYQPSAVSHENR